MDVSLEQIAETDRFVTEAQARLVRLRSLLAGNLERGDENAARRAHELLASFEQVLAGMRAQQRRLYGLRAAALRNPR
jgi:hypothetical protein